MTIQQACDVYMRADATLMAYLGGAVAPTPSLGRLYYMAAPEGAVLPYVVYHMAGDMDAQEFIGTANTGQGIISFGIVTADTGKTNGLAIRDRIRTLMRYNAGSHGGLTMFHIVPAGMREEYHEDTKRCVFSADYEVHAQY